MITDFVYIARGKWDYQSNIVYVHVYLILRFSLRTENLEARIVSLFIAKRYRVHEYIYNPTFQLAS